MEEEDDGSGQTLGAVVQIVMEALSDSVSQLVLLVITLQEQNAALPPNVPSATEAVVQASSTLTQVARGLATEEYTDYVEIQTKIIQAASEMDLSGVKLKESVDFLASIPSSSKRSEAWGKMLDAAKLIAGKTISILQIVYGAELNRILFAGDFCLDLASKVRLDSIEENAQAFADNVSEYASKAHDFATLLQARVQDEESPLLKEQLTHASVSLIASSTELIDITNKLLANPKNAEFIRQFENISDKIQETIKSTRNPISQQLHTLDVGGENPIITKYDNLQQSYERLWLDAEDRDLILANIVDQEHHIGNLYKSIISDEPRHIASSLKSLSANNAILISKVREVAERAPSAEEKEMLEKKAQQIEESLPKMVVAAKELLTNGPNSEIKLKIAEVGNVIQGSLDAIITSVGGRKERLAEALNHQAEILGVLEVAAQSHDERGIVDSLKNIVKNQEKLMPLVDSQVYITLDLDTRHQLENAKRDMEIYLPQYVTAAKGILQNPKDLKAAETFASMTSLMRASLAGVAASSQPSSYTLLESQASRQEGDAQKLVLAAEKGDVRSVKDINNQIQDTHVAFTEAVQRELKDMSDSEKREMIQEDLMHLGNLLVLQSDLALEASKFKKPRHGSERLSTANSDVFLAPSLGAVSCDPSELAELGTAFESLQTINSDVAESAADIVQSLRDDVPLSLHKLENVIKDGDIKTVNEALRSVKAAVMHSVDVGRTAAESAPTPAIRVHLTELSNELEQMIERHAEAAREVVLNPNSAEAKVILEALNECIKETVHSLDNPLESNPDARAKTHLVEHIKQEQKLLRDLEEEVVHGNMESGVSVARDLAVTHGEVMELTTSISSNIRDPTTKLQLLQASEQIQNLAPRSLALVKDIVNGKKDAQTIQSFHSVIDGSYAALDSMAKSARYAPEVELAVATREYALQLQNLSTASQSQVTPTTQAMQATVSRFLEAAWDPSFGTEGGKSKAKVKKEATELAQLVSEQRAAEAEFERSPQDKIKQAKVEEGAKTVLNKMQKITGGNAVGASIAGELVHVDVAVSVMEAAILSGEPKAMQTAVQEFVQRNRALTLVAKESIIPPAMSVPKPTQVQFSANINYLEEQLLPKAVASALEVAKNPNDLALKQKASALLNDYRGAVQMTYTNSNSISSQNKKNFSIININPHPPVTLQKIPNNASNAQPITPSTAAITPPPSIDEKTMDKVSNIQSILPEFVTLAEAANFSPTDTSSQKQLEGLASKLSNSITQYLESSTPTENLVGAIDVELDNLSKLNEATMENDENTIVELAKTLTQNQSSSIIEQAKSIVSKFAQTGEVSSISNLAAVLSLGNDNSSTAQYDEGEIKQQVVEAIASLETSIPETATAAKEFLQAQKTGKDEALARLKLLAASKRMGQDLRLIKDGLHPSAEVKVVQLSKVSGNQMQYLVEAIGSRDKAKTAVFVEQIKTTSTALGQAALKTSFARRDKDHELRVINAIQQLESRLKSKDLDEAAKEAAENPADITNLSRFELAKKRIEDSIAHVARQTKSPAIAAATGEASALNRLQRASMRGDAQAVLASAKTMAARQVELIKATREEIETIEDPETRRSTINHLNELEQLLPQAIIAAKAVVQDPKNESGRKQMEAVLAKMNVPISGVTSVISPNENNQIEALARKETSLLVTLEDKIQKGDVKGAEETQNELFTTHTKLETKAKNLGRTNNVKSASIEKAVQELEKNIKKLAPAVKDLKEGKVAKKVVVTPSGGETQVALNSIIDQLIWAQMLPDATGTAKSNARTLLQILRAGELDPKKLINASTDLAGVLSKLVDLTKDTAYTGAKSGKGGAVSKAALSINDMLSALETTAKNQPNTPQVSIDSLVNQLNVDLQSMGMTLDSSKTPKKVDTTPSKSTSTTTAPTTIRTLTTITSIPTTLATSKTTTTTSSPSTPTKPVNTTGLPSRPIGSTAPSQMKPKQTPGNYKQQSYLESYYNKPPARKPIPQVIVTQRAPKLRINPSENVPPSLAQRKLRHFSRSFADKEKLLEGANLSKDISQVASDIKQVLSTSASSSATQPSQNLTQELERLANYTKENKRQEVLISGRNVSAQITNLCENFKIVSKEVSNPIIQDKILKSSQAMKNLGIQLKILASVKAASAGGDSDADEQLSNLVKQLGSMLIEAIKSVESYKKTTSTKPPRLARSLENSTP